LAALEAGERVEKEAFRQQLVELEEVSECTKMLV
jgi:hypothetical protein